MENINVFPTTYALGDRACAWCTYVCPLKQREKLIKRRCHLFTLMGKRGEKKLTSSNEGTFEKGTNSCGVQSVHVAWYF